MDKLIIDILKSGAVVNFFLVILGSLIGMIFKKGLPERIKSSIFSGMALCVIYIGITGLFEENANILVIIISFALGAIIGELLDLDKTVHKLGEKIESKFNNKHPKIAEGFVSATLLFCVGAMTVVGSIESGINGDNYTLYSKSMIDCIAAATLASTLGIGVMLSSLSVLFIEGGITLLAVFISPILTDISIANMSIIGSLLIIALGLNMLQITKLKIMNYVPCIFIPLLLCLFI